MLAKSSLPVLPAFLASALGTPHLTIFIFGHSKYFWSSSSIPCSLTFWAFIWYFFYSRTFFLFSSPPLKNSCSFFRSEFWALPGGCSSGMPQVWQRCFSHDLCPIVSSGQELPCANCLDLCIHIRRSLLWGQEYVFCTEILCPANNSDWRGK